MAKEQSDYIFGDTGSDEVRRLTEQHQITTHGLHGRLIQAPLDLSQPHLSILDSACANGLWLHEVSTQLKPPYRLVGADLFSFPDTALQDLNFIQHDFTVPWPSDLHGKFDLVHQRSALQGARSSSVEDAIGLLLSLLKPGGWVQLVEMDLSLRPVDGPAIRNFNRTLITLMEKGG